MNKQYILASDIIDFWYSDPIKKQWFASTLELDRTILEQYGDIWSYALSSGLDNWMQTAEGSLALIIILDQFPLNMFRHQAKSFSSEAKSIEVALHAIDNKFEQQLSRDKRSFLIMPLMHSEQLQHQDLSVKLFTDNALESNIRFAKHHREIIRKFGRFPHRNKILGRESTIEEVQYLNSKEAFLG